jgi:hypothetical protein
VPIGHWSARWHDKQRTKFAAIKRRWHHERTAPEMPAAWRDVDNELNAITIPYLKNRKPDVELCRRLIYAAWPSGQAALAHHAFTACSLNSTTAIDSRPTPLGRHKENGPMTAVIGPRTRTVKNALGGKSIPTIDQRAGGERPTGSIWYELERCP